MPEANCENSTCNIEVIDQKGYIEQWALVYKGELAGIYGSFESAWTEAAIRFHHRRCMVRQISNPPLTVSVSAENVQEANSKLFMLFQKWTRVFARRFFPENEVSY